MLVLLLTLIIQPNMCSIKSCRPLGVGVFSVRRHLSNSWWNPRVSSSSQPSRWDCTYLCWGGWWRRPRWRWCPGSGTAEPGSDYIRSISDCTRDKRFKHLRFDIPPALLILSMSLVILHLGPCKATVSNAYRPESLDQPLHFLSFSLNFNLSLELPESVIQVHPWEVHLIHHAAETHTHKQSCHFSLKLASSQI